MTIFVNRILNMKKIKVIGFDMDYTLVRYHMDAFEELTHRRTLQKLVEVRNYPKEVLDLKFKGDLVIQGLIIDRSRGNLLHVNRYGKVKNAQHGMKKMNFRDQQNIYGNYVIDLSENKIQSLDTSFAVSNGVLYAQLVELKDKGLELPDYEILSYDIKEMLDFAHSDGSIKNEVQKQPEKYIILDPEVAQTMEIFKNYGKRLIVITNSDFYYTKFLLDLTITPYLKEHKCWSELFEITITLSMKPRFFYDKYHYLSIDPKTGLMSNNEGDLKPGVYQGGNAQKLQDYLEHDEGDILYLGDHIYGDVVSLKKSINWRTGLVLDPLADEINAITKAAPHQSKIDTLMVEKSLFESQLNQLELKGHGTKKSEKDKENMNAIHSQLENINNDISETLEKYRLCFNPHWGEIMRAGQEESRFADQVEKYACIYMSKVTDLLHFSPRTYFRPIKRILPHEHLLSTLRKN